MSCQTVQQGAPGGQGAGTLELSLKHPPSALCPGIPQHCGLPGVPPPTQGWQPGPSRPGLHPSSTQHSTPTLLPCTPRSSQAVLQCAPCFSGARHTLHPDALPTGSLGGSTWLHFASTVAMQCHPGGGGPTHLPERRETPDSSTAEADTPCPLSSPCTQTSETDTPYPKTHCGTQLCSKTMPVPSLILGQTALCQELPQIQLFLGGKVPLTSPQGSPPGVTPSTPQRPCLTVPILHVRTATGRKSWQATNPQSQP